MSDVSSPVMIMSSIKVEAWYYHAQTYNKVSRVVRTWWKPKAVTLEFKPIGSKWRGDNGLFEKLNSLRLKT